MIRLSRGCATGEAQSFGVWCERSDTARARASYDSTLARVALSYVTMRGGTRSLSLG